MKLILLFVCSALVSVSANAGPRHLNANFQSRILGSLQLNMKVSETTLPVDSRPTTWADIEKDNGQIIGMNCVTAAKFTDVARVNASISNGSQVILQKNASFDVSVSDSYPMQSEHEVCNAVPLHEIEKAYVSNFFEAVQPVTVNGEVVYLSISGMPFPSPLDVTVSGDENRISLDQADLFAGPRKPMLNYSIYKRTGASTTYLEHGSMTLVLQ